MIVNPKGSGGSLLVSVRVSGTVDPPMSLWRGNRLLFGSPVPPLNGSFPVPVHPSSSETSIGVHPRRGRNNRRSGVGSASPEV